MSSSYEFGYQSRKQKMMLVIVKLAILLSMAWPLYVLGWATPEDLPGKMRSIAGVLTGFWLYANVLRVKVEIQELFVPPIRVDHARELMIAALALFLASHAVGFL